MSRIAGMATPELQALVESGGLDEAQALEVLRNPFCTLPVAERLMASRQLLGSHVVRERLAGFPGMPFAAALDLLATLPWLSLLHIAQAPRTPPLVRRHAERRLHGRLHRLSLGETTALARLAHRPLIRSLGEAREPQVLEALLDNPRMVENDLLVLLSRRTAPPEVVTAALRHRRWGRSYSVRLAVATHPSTPLPLAISALVQLRRSDVAELRARADLKPELREAAAALVERVREHAPDGGTIPR